MTVRLTATESQDLLVELSADEEVALARAGEDLAGTREYWGDDESTATRTVIRVSRAPGGKSSVKIIDAVGLISVGSVQISVQPKINFAHLLHLFAASGQFPRLGPQTAQASIDTSLWAVVAKWYVDALDHLLRRDLLRDYQEVRERLPAARGRTDTVRMASDYYRGLIGFPSTFHEFTHDMPLNRVLLRAAQIVRGSADLEADTRAGARRAMMRMDGVGEMLPSDMRHKPERRMHYYRDAFELAHHVIRSAGRSVSHGAAVARTFLIRTPEMVEEGLRVLLQQNLGHRWSIDKKGRQIGGTTMRLQPDLVFNGGLGTGDVKYKLVNPDWKKMRNDLYQAIAFATVYCTNEAMIVRFRTDDRPPSPPIQVGEMNVTPFEWDARPGVAPEEAAAVLSAEVDLWLTTLSSR